MSNTMRLFVVGLFLLLVGLAGIMRAQPRVTVRADPRAHFRDDAEGLTDEEHRVVDETVLALARICMSERDVHLETNDCPAIIEVIVFRAELLGISYLAMARRYSPEATGARPPRSMRQRWVSGLQFGDEPPPAWAAMNEGRVARDLYPLPWRNYLPAWHATLVQVRQLLAFPRQVCAGGVPMHWGGACNPDGTPASRTGVCDAPPAHWIKLDCGNTVNHFFEVPRVRRVRTGTLRAEDAR